MIARKPVGEGSVRVSRCGPPSSVVPAADRYNTPAGDAAARRYVRCSSLLPATRWDGAWEPGGMGRDDRQVFARGAKWFAATRETKVRFRLGGNLIARCRPPVRLVAVSIGCETTTASAAAGSKALR